MGRGNKMITTKEQNLLKSKMISSLSHTFVSHLTLRRIIGLMGFALPILLAGGCRFFGDCDTILSTLSHYYHTVMRDVFVGILFTLAWFLFSYRGYDKGDNIAGDLGCIFALGVALFPAGSQNAIVGALHYFSATMLFSILAYFSICLFTKTDGKSKPTEEKRIRNRIYKACGIAMIICMVLIALYNLFLQNTWIADLKPVFWLESLILWAFGISWFIKGETLWTDSNKLMNETSSNVVKLPVQSR